MSRNNSPKVTGSPAKRGSITPKVSSPMDSILRLSQNASMFVESVNPLSESGKYKRIENEDIQEATTDIPLDDNRQAGQSSQQAYPQAHPQAYPQSQYNQQPAVYVQTNPAAVVMVDPLLEPLNTRTLLYIFVYQMVGSFVINFGLCFLIAWAMYNDQPGNVVGYASGLTSAIADVAVTAFVVPLACCLIGTCLIKGDLRMGKIIQPIDKRWLNLRVFRAVPTDQRWRWLIPRALVIGFYFFLLFFPATIGFLYAAHPSGFMTAEWNYIAFKGYWSALEGALCMPLIAFIPLATKEVQQVPLAVRANGAV